MPKNLPIGIVFAGGTTITNKGKIFSVNSPEDADNWIKIIPEIKIISPIKKIFAYPEINPFSETQKWEQLSTLIEKNLDDCQGFIISYPLESLEYASCALSFSLNNINKPVILTGNFSQNSENPFKEFSNLEIKSNFLNSAHLATLDLPETAIVFGDRIIKATRSTYSPKNLFTPFEQIDKNPLGKIDLNISINQKPIRKFNNQVKSKKFENKILTIEIHPGTCLTSLESIINHTYKGVIFKLKESTQIPKDQLKKITDLSQKNQVASIFYFSIDQTIPKNIPQKIITINNMTFPSVFTKLSWALGQTQNYHRIKTIFETDYIGEIIETSI